MKRIFFAILLAAACSTMVNAQSTEKVDENAPEITFTSTEYDYGVVAVNSDGTRKFEFTNTGKQPLILSNVSASCGCTVVEWAKDPVKPGEKGTITVKYNIVIVGTFQKSIRVFSNAKTSPVMLVIKGEVKPNEPAPHQ